MEQGRIGNGGGSPVSPQNDVDLVEAGRSFIRAKGGVVEGGGGTSTTINCH